MRCFAYLFLLLTVSFSATAATVANDNVAARVAAADKLAATPSGQVYQKQLNELLTPRVLGIMLKKCSLTTGIAPMDFTLVANISAYRTLQDYVESPDNKLTQCMGPRLTGVCYPWIPAEYKGRGYPIALKIKASYAEGVVIKKGERLRLNGTCPGF